MQPSVTAVLVARNGAQYLPRTLAAVAAQTRRPDTLILVDDDSGDGTAALLAPASGHQPGTHLVTTPARRSFGGAVAHALQSVARSEQPDEWLWLLGHDNAPEPGALAALLGAVEVSPSVAVAGPKLMRWDAPDVIADFGQSLTRFGRTVHLVADELDQAQHDRRSDVLAVSGAGMLVRRSLWTALGGFDPALPTADAGLDFSVRARLAGHRVVGVPSARVASAGPPELFGRRSLSAGAQNRIRRSAQLHRRLAYAPAAVLPLHWLSLVPLAVARSLWHLLAKRPGAVGGELAAGFRAAFDGGVPNARRRLRRTRTLGWGAIRPLRATSAHVRELRGHAQTSAAPVRPQHERPGFFTGGGAWAVLLTAVLGAVVLGGFTAGSALTGGGLAPLSAGLAELWGNVGWGWHDVGSGFTGPADPFASVLAVLGTLTFWSPSTAIVLLFVFALPLAAVGAWFLAARVCERPWAPVLAAFAWALAPPLLVSLAEGRLGAVIAHLLLPPLVLAVLGAARSWAAAAAGALAFAAVAASAPSIVPALVVGIVAWMLARPTGIHRLVLVLVPAAVLFAPLIVEQVRRGTPLALLADPGLPVLAEGASGIHLALGDPAGGLLGWGGFLAGFGLDPALAGLMVPVLMAPVAALALTAPFLPGARRSVPALLLALLGFATAVAASHLHVTVIGSQTTAVWAGPGLSLYWLGLLGAAAVTLEVLRGAAAVPALAAIVAVVGLGMPVLGALMTGQTAVQASNGRMLPAFATAEAASSPDLGTIVLTPQPDGGIAAALHRGEGTTLDEQSTLEATRTDRTDRDDVLARVAGNLASRSGLDVAAELDALRVAFVVVPDPRAGGAEEAVHRRMVEALDGNRALTPVGDTAFGTLWHYPALADGVAPTGPRNTATPLGVGILVALGVVFGLVLLLAVPTTRRRRVRAARADAVPFLDAPVAEPSVAELVEAPASSPAEPVEAPAPSVAPSVAEPVEAPEPPPASPAADPVEAPDPETRQRDNLREHLDDNEEVRR